MIEGLAHVNLRAPRALLERLRAFYCEVVGLQEGPRPPFPSRGHWLYAGDRDVVHLSERHVDADPDTAHPCRGSYDHVAFQCTDLAGTEARLRQLGVAYDKAQVPGLGLTQLFLQDPAGHGVELSFAAEPGAPPS